MPAELSYNKNGEAEMFSGQGIVPWHKEGTIVEGLLTAEEAIKAAHLDWTVEKTPLYVQPLKKVAGWEAIRRTDDGRVLGVAKGQYTVIQNCRSFDFFDSIIGKGQAVYDTAGALRDGAIVWVMARLPAKMFIGNDAYEKQVLLCTSHNGTLPLSVQIVTTRVVCANTLSVALHGASNIYKIRHFEKFEDKLQQAQEALQLAEAYYDNLKGLLEVLQSKPMDTKEMQNFTAQLFPAKEEKQDDGSISIPTRTRNVREAVETLFVRGQGNQGRTRYDALNAVTEWVDHSRIVKGKSTRFESSLLGSGVAVKAKALNLLVE